MKKTNHLKDKKMLTLNIEENKKNAEEFRNKFLKTLKDKKNDILEDLSISIFEIKKNSIKNRNKTKLKIKKNIKQREKELKENIKKDLNKGLRDEINFIFTKYFSDTGIENIILKEPSNLKELIKNFSNEDIIKNNKDTKLIIDIFLKKIFIENGYNKLVSSDKKKFFNLHKIKTCTYCNRNYVFDVKEHGLIKGQIDHFYPKDMYPYLAMSYYNLIPCCSICNYIKGKFDTFTKDSINPYLRKNHKLFETDPISNMKYELKPFNDDLLKHLKIKEIYNEGHIDIVNDLYIKFFHENSEKYFDGLKKAHDELKLKEEDYYRFITNSYKEEKEFHKRSFSKMTYDLIQEEFEKFY